MSSEPWTLCVRSGGSDSNTGLSASDALATVSEAITRVPRLGIENRGGPSVTIDVESGATFTEDVLAINIPWHSKIFISASSGSNAIIESTASTVGLTIQESRVYLENITLRPADPGTPYEKAVEGSAFASVSLRGTTQLEGGTASVLRAQNQSRLTMGTDVAVIGDGAGSTTDAVVVYKNSSGQLDGTISDASTGGRADRNSAIVSGASIDNCTTGLKAQDGGVIKQVGSSITNCTTAYQPDDGGFIKSRDGVSFTGTSNKIPTTFEGSYVDLDDGTRAYDGLLKFSSGTITVPAGGSQRLPSNHSTGVNELANVYFAPASGPGLDAEINLVWRWDNSLGVMRPEFQETLGSTDIDIEYAVVEYMV